MSFYNFISEQDHESAADRPKRDFEAEQNALRRILQRKRDNEQKLPSNQRLE